MKSIFTFLKRQIIGMEFCAACAAIAIVVYVLFTRPIAGVSNNGDYIRIMKLTGLQFIQDTRYVNLDQYFMFGKNGAHDQFFITSHILPVLAAEFLNRWFFSNKFFDIRYLGFVFSIFFVISIYILAKCYKTGKRLIDAIYFFLIILLLCDIGYLSYFNSLLGEAAITVTFLLMLSTISLILYQKRVSVPLIFLYFITSVLFISAKQSNIPMGIFITLFGLTLLTVDRRPRIVISLVLTSFLLSGISIWLYLSTPSDMEMTTKHQTVFYGILKDSPTPEKDLEFLGINRELAVLKETSFFDANVPIPSHSKYMNAEFYNKISFFKVLNFYLHHPSRFIQKMEITARNSTMIRAPYLGNSLFKDTGERFSFNNKFSLWSTFKKTYLPNTLLFVVIFFAAYLMVLIFEFTATVKKGEWFTFEKINLFLLLWIIAASQFVIPILGDGEVDLAKHMFMYNLCFDIMLLSAVIWSAYRIGDLCHKVRLCSPHMRERTLVLASSITIVLVVIGTFSISRLYIRHKAETGKVGANASVGVGKYIMFGEYRGNGLLWQLISKDRNGITIASDKVISFKAFDAARRKAGSSERNTYGSNDWETSTLRKWLNSDSVNVDYGDHVPNKYGVWKGEQAYENEPGFLSYFNESERELIRAVPRKSILSTYDLKKEKGGNNYYLWTNVIPLLMQNYDRAYSQLVTDKVSLLDVRDLKQLIFDNGLECRRKATDTALYTAALAGRKSGFVDYWLRTPYSTRETFTRYVGYDGYVYHKDAYFGKIGVLPVMCISNENAIITGNGSIKDAYTIRAK